MNELQIKLTGDITALVSALNKAKATIKSFESETEKESEKGNVGFKRKIGLIEQLTNKAKQLRVALSQATNEKQIEAYNQELENTSKELTRLNALGRTVTANLSGVGGGFNQIATKGANANGVALEFNRIIQDAPFGLIGIGNNLQQLAGNFAQVNAEAKKAGGTVGTALKASLTSIVSPVNLGLLAISALTAAFTAYQMGAFDFLKSTEAATDGIEKYNEEIQKTIDNLSAFEKVNLNAANSVEKEKIEIDSLFNILRDTNLSQETRVGAYNKLISLYPNLLKGLTQEKALTGDLTNEYKLLAEAIGQKALASALEGELIESFKEQFDIQKQLNSEKKEQIRIEDELLAVLIEEERQARLVRGANKDGLALMGQQLEVDRSRSQALDEQLKSQKEVVRLTERLITAQGEEAEQLKVQLLEANKQVAILFGFGESPDPIKPLEETVKRAKDDLTQLNVLLERASLLRRDAFFAGVEAPMSVESGAATTQGIIIPDDVQSKVTDNLKEQKALVDELSGAYAGLGSLIGKAFKNPTFGSFLGQFIPFAAKLIATNFKVGTSAAIAKGAQDSIFGGPFTTGAFIAAAVGLVASAFASIGGGSGAGASGVAASSGAPPQIFTNKNTVTPPNQNSPNYNPGSDIDWDKAQGRLFVDIEFDKLRFGLDMASERKQSGG